MRRIYLKRYAVRFLLLSLVILLLIMLIAYQTDPLSSQTRQLNRVDVNDEFVQQLNRPGDVDLNQRNPEFHHGEHQPAAVDEHRARIKKPDDQLNIPPPPVDSHPVPPVHQPDLFVNLTPKVPPPMSSYFSFGPGENGKAYNVDVSNLSLEEKAKYDLGQKNNAFNEYASNQISVRRYISDIRDSRCKSTTYPNAQMAASVIICFHNEAWSALLRSVHSVIDRSPKNLLKEIVLVDDASTMSHLREPLEVYMQQLNIVKIVRASQRQGLIRARIEGTKAATGSVLIFLDSHIECTAGWLEPLLDRIGESEFNVAVPVIDVISDVNLAYSHAGISDIQIGVFNWDMQFRWMSAPEDLRSRTGAPVSPLRTPTMAGGLFAISTKFFQHLGYYDPGFEVWGAENLELSFKTWMCGGVLEIIPCSRVGHIFRSTSPYSWKVKVNNPLQRNSLRLVEVWLDEYKQFYYERLASNSKLDFGDVSERKKLRKDLHCKSFKWFMNTIAPFMFDPSEAKFSGAVRNQAADYCLDAVADKKKSKSPVKVWPCHNAGGNQHWLFSKMDEMRRDDFCFDAGYNVGHIVIVDCHGQGGMQTFSFSDDQFKTVDENCLEMDEDKVGVSLRRCNGSSRQKWKWDIKPKVPAPDKKHAAGADF